MAALDVEKVLPLLAQHSGCEVALVATAGGLVLRLEGHGERAIIGGFDSAAELLAAAARHLANRCYARARREQTIALTRLAIELEVGAHAG